MKTATKSICSRALTVLLLLAPGLLLCNAEDYTSEEQQRRELFSFTNMLYSLHICKAPGPVCGPPVCTPRSRLDQCQKYFKCHSDGTCFFDSQSCLAGEGCSQFYRQCEDGEGCEYKMCEVGEAYCDYRCDDGICEKLDLVGRCAADDTECIQFFQYFDSGGSGGGGGGSSGSGSSGGSSSSSGSGSSGGSSSSGSDSNSSSGSGSNSDGSNSDGSNSDGSSGGNSVANRDIVAGNGNAVSQQAKFKSMIFYLLPVVAAALIIAYAVWPRAKPAAEHPLKGSLNKRMRLFTRMARPVKDKSKELPLTAGDITLDNF